MFKDLKIMLYLLFISALLKADRLVICQGCTSPFALVGGKGSSPPNNPDKEKWKRMDGWRGEFLKHADIRLACCKT